jgi:hypothetical protein
MREERSRAVASYAVRIDGALAGLPRAIYAIIPWCLADIAKGVPHMAGAFTLNSHDWFNSLCAIQALDRNNLPSD